MAGAQKEYPRKSNFTNFELLKRTEPVVVELKLFATFRKGPFKQKCLELPEGTLLSEIVEPLKLPDKPPKILRVNGIAVTNDCTLDDKEVIAIFPMIAGG